MTETTPQIDLVCSNTDLDIAQSEPVSVGPGYACDVPAAPHGIVAISEAEADSVLSVASNKNSGSLPDGHDSEIGCAIIASDTEGNLVLSGTVVDINPNTVVADPAIRRYHVDSDPDGGRLAEEIDKRKHETVDPFGVTVYESMRDSHQNESDTTTAYSWPDTVHRRMENAARFCANDDPWLECSDPGLLDVYQFETGVQPTPADVLAEETLLMPDIAGQKMPTHYRESMYVYLLRLWCWLQAEAIDPTQYLGGPMRVFDEDYDEPLALAADLGLSTNNAPITQKTALHVHDQGFNAWRIGFGGQLKRWAPTTEFEWTEDKKLSDWRERADQAGEDSFAATVLEQVDRNADHY